MYKINLTDGISYALSAKDYEELSRANQIGYFSTVESVEWIEENEYAGKGRG